MVIPDSDGVKEKGQSTIQLCQLCHPNGEIAASEARASFKCKSCPPSKCFMCTGCRKDHDANHQVDGYTGEPGEYGPDHDAKENLCSKHPGREFTQSCKNCSQLLCPICVHGQCLGGLTPGSNHEPVQFSYTTDRHQAQLYKDIDVAEGEVVQLADQLGTLERQKMKLDENTQFVNSQIQKAIQQHSQTTVYCTAKIKEGLVKVKQALEKKKAVIQEARVLAESKSHLEVHKKTDTMTAELKIKHSGEALTYLPVMMMILPEHQHMGSPTRSLGAILQTTHTLLPRLKGDIHKQCASFQSGSTRYMLEAFEGEGLYITADGGIRKQVNSDSHVSVCCTKTAAYAVTEIRSSSRTIASIRKYRIELRGVLTKEKEQEVQLPCCSFFFGSLTIYSADRLAGRCSCGDRIHLFTSELTLHETVELKTIFRDNRFAGTQGSIRVRGCSDQVLISGSFYFSVFREGHIWSPMDNYSAPTVALVSPSKKSVTWRVRIPHVDLPIANVQVIDDFVYCMHTEQKKMTILSLDGKVEGMVECPEKPVHASVLGDSEHYWSTVELVFSE